MRGGNAAAAAAGGGGAGGGGQAGLLRQSLRVEPLPDFHTMWLRVRARLGWAAASLLPTTMELRLEGAALQLALLGLCKPVRMRVTPQP